MKNLIIIAAAMLSAVALSGCINQTPSARNQTQAAAESSQQRLLAATPIPALSISQERENLVKRAKRINVQNMTSCITLFSQNGVVVGFFPVAGKVSSLNSYLLPGDQAVRSANGNFTVEAPDIDGAYGENADGIFFFTADSDAYVEWKGDYFWSDQCLSPSVQPLLVQHTSEQ